MARGEHTDLFAFLRRQVFAAHARYKSLLVALMREDSLVLKPARTYQPKS